MSEKIIKNVVLTYKVIPDETPKSQVDLIASLETALNNLLSKHRVDGVGYGHELLKKQFVPHFASQLAILRNLQTPYVPPEDADVFVRSSSISLANYRNKYEDISATKTKKELSSVERKAFDLWKELTKLHSPALHALDYLPSGVAELQSLKNMLLALAATAKAAVPPVTNGAKKGRKPETRRYEVAVRVAEVYRVLLGKLPTVSTNASAIKSNACGPFLEFLAEVYQILGYPCQVEDLARRAARRLKKMIAELQEVPRDGVIRGAAFVSPFESTDKK
jgi:hypothetical protein